MFEDLVVPFHEQIFGFAGERVDTRGYIDLCTYLGTGRIGDERRVRYLLVEANTSYNVLLGRQCLNAFGAIVSIPHLTLKYPSEAGKVIIVRADQKTARECYAAGFKLYPKRHDENSSGQRSPWRISTLEPTRTTKYNPWASYAKSISA